MRKRVYILGLVVGIIAPVLGLFVGLQVSPVLGSILVAPLFLLSLITGDSLGGPGGFMQSAISIVGILISIGLWTAVFALVDKFVQKKS